MYVYICIPIAAAISHNMHVESDKALKNENLVQKQIAKLCYVSSIATLGNTLNNTPIDEETVWNPEADNNAYAITKYGAEMEVWRGTQEGLNAVIVNPGVIIGSGIWKYGTGNLFKKAHKGLKYYSKGSVGLISVVDVVDIMMVLMKSSIINQRFVLVAENWSYKKFLQTLAQSVNALPPKKEASSLLLKIAWRLDSLNHKITGRRRQLTRHLVYSLTTETAYNSAKIKTALNYEFKAINKTISSVGQEYLLQE